MADLVYDPSSYELHDDPFPIYRRMQDEAPLYHNPDLGFWALTRFDDVVAGLADWVHLSSAKGTLIEQIQSELPPPDMMIFKDPPRHEQLRRLIGRAFTPRRVADLESSIRQMCSQCLDPMVETGGGEIVSGLASLLPMSVIAALLGVPDEDGPRVKALSDRLLHREDGSVEKPEDGLIAGAELFAYFSDLISERRRRPMDDLISDLITAEVPTAGGTERLSDDEMVYFCLLLGVAGNETTTKLISTGVVTLDAFPDQRDRLASNSDIWPSAVEELLRFDPPSHIQGRVATVPLERHGETIPEGAIVLLINGAANRDPRAFPEPDVYVAGRSIDKHLAFGHGIHFCLGAALARLEARVALQELISSFPRYSVDRTGLRRFHSTNVRGYSRVPFGA